MGEYDSDSSMVNGSSDNDNTISTKDITDELDKELSSMSDSEKTLKGMDLGYNLKPRRDIKKYDMMNRDSYKDMAPIVGMDYLDMILNKKQGELKQNHNLVVEWGCAKCTLRGTDDCPYGIQTGERHANGYCEDRLVYHLLKLKVWGTTEGLRYIRNINMEKMDELVEYYRKKFNDVRKEGKVTGQEIAILKNLMKLQKNLHESIENAIKQDEGIKIQHTDRDLTPTDLNRIFQRANEKVVDVTPEDDTE